MCGFGIRPDDDHSVEDAPSCHEAVTAVQVNPCACACALLCPLTVKSWTPVLYYILL